MKRKVMMLVGIIAIMITMLLWYGSAMAEIQSGNYDGMDWSLDTETGVLTLGRFGETQTLAYRDSRAYSSWPWSGVRTAITSVCCDGPVILNGSVRDMFYWFSSATTIDVSLFDVSNVTSMQQMFYCCKQLGSLDLRNWNTSLCFDMINMFRDCDNLDLSCVVNLDTENVTSFNGMFYSCDNLTSLDLSGWNTSHVTDIGWMFAQNINVTSLDLSGWDVSHVVSMDNTFQSCSKLTNIDLTDWNISVLTNASSAFASCKLLQNLDLSGWNVSHLTTASSMFSACESLANLDMTGWAPSTLTNISLMFYNCKKLTSLDLSGWDVSHVTSIESLFWGCSKLETLDLTGWNPSSANLALRCIFYDCGSLRSLDLSGWDISRASSLEALFYGCGKLEDLNLTGWDTSNVTRIDRIFYACTNLTSIDVSGWDTSKVIQMYQAFFNCCNLTELDLSGWDVSHVTNMWAVFSACRKLSSLDVSTWDVSSVTKMESMFGECESLVTLNITDWDTHSVEDFERMFYGCTKLNIIDVSHFNTSAATDMHYMFYSCSDLVALGVSNWNVSNVTTMGYMFAMCRKLTQVDVSAWDVSCVSEMDSMFYGCNSLRQLNLSDWVTSGLVTMRLMFSGCNVELLDLSGFDTDLVTNMAGAYDGSYALCEVILGEQNPFIGRNAVSAVLPLPKAEKDGVAYTQKWIREDKTYGPYTPEELRDNYTSAMAGKWVWEKVPTEYTITFVCTEDDYLGDMPSVTAEAAEDYVLPGNAFRVFGYEFDNWTDGTRRIWMDKDTIPANTYAANAAVTLTAVFAPRDRSIDMQDGSFDFSIKGNEKALFRPIPASTSYQVYEQTPFGWNLIKQSNNVGEITPDEESEALFLNKYDPLKVTIRFAGTKLMNESAADPDSFNFLLYEDETLIDIASVSEGGAIEFQPIEYDASGDHHYYIKEVIGSDNAVEYDTHVEEITVSITSDGVGHLSADVTMDEDQILFENKSKPGMLALRKLNATTDDRDGVFYYEVQFSSENGQPYDLLSSDISYEEREGNVSEFPEVQPLPEKPKYTLTVEHIAVGANLAETVKQSVEYQYCAGDVVTINGADTSRWTSGQLYYVPSEVDSIAVRVSDGVYKFIMPAQNLTVQLKYDLYQSLGMKVYWTGVDYLRPDLTVDVFADGDYIQSVIIHEDDPALSSSETVYTGVRYYDDNGQVIEYTTALSVVPEDYYLEQQTMSYGIWRFYMHAGYRAYVIWDDFNNAYGTRPSSMNVTYTNCAGTSWQSFVSEPLWRKDLESDGANYRDHDFDLQITNIPAGYEIVAPTEGDELGKYDKKLKLVARLVSGSIVWDDNNDANGVRPENVTVKLMNGETVVSTQNVSIVSEWQFSFTNLPVTDENGLIDYTVAVDDVAGYTKSVDGTTITMTKIPTVEIPITDVTLLSASEYNTYRSQIPSISAYWWLRGPGSWWSPSMYVPSNVMPDGSVEVFYASNGNFGIRPVLVCDLNGTGLEIGNKLQFAGYDWTVISDSLVLCDSCVGNSPFGPGNTWVKSQSETLTTPYDDSYAKTWVENWAAENGLMSEPEFEITDVTLLSKNEYDTYRDAIAFDMAQWWWLRSPGSSSKYANFVRSDTGNVGNYAHSVSTDYFGVRPALICDLDDVGYSVGDKVSGSGYEWTVISNSISVTDDPYNGHGLILCDETVGQTAFKADDTASDANVYDASDVKQWLANWVAAHPFWSKTVTAAVIQ